MKYYLKIAETCCIKEIFGCDQYFVVNQTNGCWSVFDSKFINLVSSFIGKSICSLDLDLSKEELALLKNLFNQGVLEINGASYLIEKTITETDNNLTIILNTTNKCNLNCRYCYAYTSKNSSAKYSPNNIISDLERLLGNNKDRNISIVFHGGEPLLCWNEIVQMTTTLNDRFTNVSFSIQTNGLLINKDIVDFVRKNNIKIGVSLDGYNKQTNINRFGDDKHEYLARIIDNVELLIHNNVQFGLLSVVTKDNYQELFNSILFFVNKGVKHFGLNFFLPKGRGELIDNDVSINELANIFVKLACYINDYNAQQTPQNFISERIISVLIYSLSHKQLGACFTAPCDAGEKFYALDVNGDVYPCDEFVGSKEFCIGNIRHENFSIDKHNNENIQILKHRNNCCIKRCSHCHIKELCTFKCPSESFYRTGDLYTPHSMCEFAQIIIPQYMYLLQNNIINPKYFIFN